MTDALVVVAFSAVTLPLLVVSWRAFWCNVRLYRQARASAPLDGLDLTGLAVVPVRPRGWPIAEEITDPHIVAAYALLAEDRALTTALLGEVLAIAGGAAVGTAIPLALSGPAWGVFVVLVALAVAGWGVVCGCWGCGSGIR